MPNLKLLKPIKDYSFEIDTEDALLNSFSEKDQKKLVMPSKFVFPLRTEHYFTWASPDGLYVYLVFKKPEWRDPRGVVFRGRNSSGTPMSSMCDWCHSFGASDEIGMLLTSVTSTKSVGMNLCLDLSCIEKTETIALIAGKNFDKLAEKVCEGISNFYEHTLKVSADDLQ